MRPALWSVKTTPLGLALWSVKTTPLGLALWSVVNYSIGAYSTGARSTRIMTSEDVTPDPSNLSLDLPQGSYYRHHRPGW